MTLFSLARKNIAGNFKNYLIYFVSLTLSVVIYFTFVSMQYSRDISTSSMPADIIRSIFLQASILLILFVIVFVWYSNAFFTRKRKKEVGLYALLGMRKKTIGRMLFYENVIMGAVSIVVGIVLGAMLSKLFTLILLRMLGSGGQVGFSLSGGAIANTVLVFAGILLLTSVNSYRLIYRFKLLELFQADQAGEAAPQAKLLRAVLAVVLIGFAYWTAGRRVQSNSEFILNFALQLSTLITGTFLLFRSLTLFVLKRARAHKPLYYKGLNLVSVSQLIYRMNGNARTLAMVTLLSTLTMLLIGVSSSTYYNNKITQERKAPFSYMHLAQGEPFDAEAERIIRGDAAHPVLAQVDLPVVKLKGAFSDPGMVPNGVEALDDRPLNFLSVSDYNRVQEALGRSTRLKPPGDNELIAIRPMFTSLTLGDFAGKRLRPELPQRGRDFSFVQVTEERVVNWRYPDFYFVVNDAVFADFERQVPPVHFSGYEVRGEADALATARQLEAVPGAEAARLSSYAAVYTAGFESAGLDMFIFAFLGLVFLAATGSVIYFKQLTDAHAEKERYAILRKVGVSRRAIHASIAKLTLFVFALPLAVGLTHSVVLLTQLTGVFSGLIDVNLAVPITATLSLYALIYALYYGLTVHSFNRIVNGR